MNRRIAVYIENSGCNLHIPADRFQNKTATGIDLEKFKSSLSALTTAKSTKKSSLRRSSLFSIARSQNNESGTLFRTTMYIQYTRFLRSEFHRQVRIFFWRHVQRFLLTRRVLRHSSNFNTTLYFIIFVDIATYKISDGTWENLVHAFRQRIATQLRFIIMNQTEDV